MLDGFDRKDVSPLRYWVHAILPLVYDDSLSYYEVLAKVSQKMNEVIEGLNKNNEQVEKVTQFTLEQVQNLTMAFNNFQESMLTRQNEFENKLLDEQHSFETQLDGEIAQWEEDTTEKFNQMYQDFLSAYQRQFGVVQTTGDSTTDVISQKAITDILALYVSPSIVIGNSDGREYTGEITSMGMLNPSKKYLIWRNAFNTFTDLDEDFKRESGIAGTAYFYLDAATWHPVRIGESTYDDFAGYDLRTTIETINPLRTVKVYHQSGAWKVQEIVASKAETDRNSTDITNLQVAVRQCLTTGSGFGSPNTDVPPTEEVSLLNMEINKGYLWWKNALVAIDPDNALHLSEVASFGVFTPTLSVVGNIDRAYKDDNLYRYCLFLRDTDTIGLYRTNKNGFSYVCDLLTSLDVLQTTGDSTTDVISQKAITDILALYVSPSIVIGNSDGREYTGEITSMGMLNPSKKYLIWRNAFNTFTDLDEDFKRESGIAGTAYFYLDAATWHPVRIGESTYDDSPGYDLRTTIETINPRRTVKVYHQSGAWKVQEIVADYNTVKTNTVNISKNTQAIADLNAKVDDLSKATASSVNLMAPNGSKYRLSVTDTGEIVAIPVVPKKTLYIGNSLLLGFSTFGMAASDNQHDYFHLVSAKTGGTTDKVAGSGFEGQTTVEGAQNWLDNTLQSHLADDIDLVIIQLGDNVNTAGKRAVFPQTCPLMLRYIREKCQKARVVWVGSWYAKDLKNIYADSCETTGCEYIDITDIVGPSAIGNIVQYPSDASFTYDVDSFEVNEPAKQVTLNFTRNAQEYHVTINYTSYTSNAGIQITVVGSQRVIVDSGVASHPGDSGMKQIADRIIEKLGI